MIDMIFNSRQNDLKYIKVSDECDVLYKNLEKTLNEEQLMMFQRFMDACSAARADEVRNAYKTGFKDGALMMQEIQG